MDPFRILSRLHLFLSQIIQIHSIHLQPSDTIFHKLHMWIYQFTMFKVNVIQKLVDAYQTSGTYTVQWNGQVKGITAASGVYFARLYTEGRQGAQSQVQRMVLLK